MVKKRIFSAAAVFALIAAILTGCASQAKEQKVVMTVDGENIYMDEYVYYMAYVKSYVESSLGSSIWQDEAMRDTYVQYAKDYAKEQVLFRKCIDLLCEQYGIELTEDEIKQLSEDKKSSIQESGGIVNWTVTLKQNGVTENVYDLISRTSTKYQKLYDYLYGENGIERVTDEEISKLYEEEYLSAAHILCSTLDNEGNALGEEERKAKYELAEQLLQRARNGEDFIQLSSEYSEDEGKAAYPDGYTFKEGDFVEEFYNAAIELEVGQISDIVESTFGYHIIKRLPLSTEYFEKNADSIRASLEEDRLYNKIDERKESLEVTISDETNDIDITNLISYI